MGDEADRMVEQQENRGRRNPDRQRARMRRRKGRDVQIIELKKVLSDVERIVWGQTYPNHKPGDDCDDGMFGCRMCNANKRLGEALEMIKKHTNEKKGN